MATERDVQVWAGDFADQLDPDQLATLTRAFTAIETRWPHPDDEDTRLAAYNAAAQVVFGDSTLEDISADWRDARRRERDAMAALTGALLASEGSERTLVERTGVARMTVRKALGR